MSTPAIIISDLSKEYAFSNSKSCLALHDLTLTIEQGEVIGVLGANGAGKSSLLKIISGITTPTKGNIRTKGSVASLLEVGTSFHPDLTGRENVLFTARLLGMNKIAARSSLDDICSFADIGSFIDVPLRYYSTGMALRLAFALIITSNPDILIIDEAFAVGDAEFQKKCIDEFLRLARSGKTIILASHDMPLLQRITTRCIRLDHGTVVDSGTPNTVIARYLSHESTQPIQDAVKNHASLSAIRDLYKQRLSVSLEEYLLYHQRNIHFAQSSWIREQSIRNPLDAWIYQEIFAEIHPDIVLEIGSYSSGNTLYLQHLLTLLGHGTVISIPQNSGITLQSLKEQCKNKKVLAIHAGPHDAPSVLRDLEQYAPLVSSGSYFIVEDTIIDIFEWGDSIGSPLPGPLSAVLEFIAHHPEFTIDTTRERYLATYHPCGFLQKKS